MINGDCGYVVHKHSRSCHSSPVCVFSVMSHCSAVPPVLVANSPVGNQNGRKEMHVVCPSFPPLFFGLSLAQAEGSRRAGLGEGREEHSLSTPFDCS